MNRTFTTLIAATCLTGAASVSSAAGLVLGLRLVNIPDYVNDPFTFTDLPVGPSGYSLTQGQTFGVVVTATVTNPNFTDTLRAGTGMDSKALGLSNLTYNIESISESPAGPKIAPVIGTAGSPPRWDHVAFAPNSFPFINLLDRGSDGDLDPVGAGLANTLLSMAPGANAAATAATLANHQVGVDGTDLLVGLYTATGIGNASLAITPGSSVPRVFSDPTTGGNNDLTTVEVASRQDGSINLSVVIPEPASLGLFGLAALAIGRRRR